MCAVGLLG
ncbi:unnamed protein product [Acanthoscelides obtectus]|uniref:Uncharacterized protein n=1 Tax=Acanthoscelides obtectus TaxID=200917 RepID=A0A9P0M060_ACAOB|nr:unnamed protein product [Acanthoscelides obtectus]CAK1667797.1 hypothetical protein AOBTE_LOCUS26040 [Acanthoscelides obtectus]